MGLGAYAFAGAMQGLGMSLVKLGEDKKAEAERKRQEEREDRLRQEDRSYREQWRNEERGYQETQRGLGAKADANVFRSIHGDGSFEAKPGTLGELLLTTESGGSFDTLFGFSNREGGKFSGTRVSQMTLGELAEFSDPSGEYGQHVKSQVGRVATPMGAGQIVGTTMRQAAKELGLSDDTVFSPEVQMQMVEHLASKALAGATSQDQKRRALRGVWEGFKNVPDAKLDAAIAAFESGDIGVTFNNPNADMYASLEDPNTSAAARNAAVDELGRRSGMGGVKLTGEEWVRRGDVEVLMGRDGNTMKPYVDEDGQPITRAVRSSNARLSSTIKTQMKDWFDENAIEQDVRDAFTLKVQRLVGTGMTEDEAWIEARRTANKTADVEAEKGGVNVLGYQLLDPKVEVTPGTYDGTFGKPRGLGAPEDPTMPNEPDGQTVSQEQAIAEAKAAIARGADRNQVIARLREMGIDPRGI